MELSVYISNERIEIVAEQGQNQRQRLKSI